MDTALLTAARAARPHLARLAGDDAAGLDTRLAGLIARSSAGDEVDEELVDALTATPDLHLWTSRLIGDTALRPVEVQNVMVRTALPGDPEPVLPPRYRCPDRTGDYVWYQLSVAEEIPRCPTHDVVLVLDEA